MNISFSEHALLQLKERNLSKEEILRALITPDKITGQSIHRFRAIRKIKKAKKLYLLIVVFDKDNSNYTIVTTFLTSKIKKYL